MKYILSLLIALMMLFTTCSASFAQLKNAYEESVPFESSRSSTFASQSALLASPSAEELKKLEELKKEDITTPEEIEQKGEIIELFQKRPAATPSITNFFAFTVQSAIRAGLPANTVILILMLPFLATIIIVIRYIIGLPTIGILFPIALSITLLATGITIGTLLLVIIMISSIIAQFLLKKIRIMHMAKLALSVLMVSIFVFASLVISISYGQIIVKNLSIFPLLLLILLSERIVAIQLERKWKETLLIAGTNISLGIVGFYILSWKLFQNFILLYPEILFILIPINIIIGRYFGLRITEYFRFKSIRNYT